MVHQTPAVALLLLLTAQASLALPDHPLFKPHHHDAASLRHPFTSRAGSDALPGASGASATRRRLAQADEPQVVRYDLVDSCEAVPENPSAVQPGFSCVVNAVTTIGRNQEVFLDFELAEDADFDMSVLVTVIDGDPDLFFQRQGQEGTTITHRSEFGSSNDVVYVDAATLRAGSYSIRLTSFTPTSTFRLEVDVLDGNVRELNPQDAGALRDLARHCCTDGCFGPLAALVDSPATTRMCEQPGFACNLQGHITHADFSGAGLTCSADLLAPLARLKHIHHLSLVNNFISGDVQVALSAISNATTLVHLGLDVNPQLGGELPTACAPPLSTLRHFSAAVTLVSGSVPACLLGVSALYLSRTSISGAIPPVPAGSNITVLQLRQSQATAALTGEVPDFSGATRLQVLDIASGALTGTLRLPPSITDVWAFDNELTGLDVGGAAELVYLDVENNQIGGPMPEALSRAPNLQVLWMENNRIESLPTEWDTPNLQLLLLNNNSIQGLLPEWIGRQGSLQWASFGNNRLQGPIAPFGASIPSSGSQLVLFEIQENELAGPLVGLHALGVFSSRAIIYQSDPLGQQFPMPHVFNASGNALSGDIPEHMVEDIVELRDNAGISMLVDLRRNNGLRCLESNGAERLNAEERDLLGCGDGDLPPEALSAASESTTEAGAGSGDGGGGGIGAGAGVGIAVGVLVAVAIVAVVVVVLVRRRRSKGAANVGNGSFSRFTDTAAYDPSVATEPVDPVVDTV